MWEFIYILVNPSMPGLVKIGRTERSVSERLRELSSHTGVPTGFCIIKEYAVADSVQAEKIIHQHLSDYRVSDNREFFKIEPDDAMDIIGSILQKREVRRDYEWEDEMVARAISIVIQAGMARPRMLEEVLAISYEEALFVIRHLELRGIIDERHFLTSKGTGFRPDDEPSPILAPNPQLLPKRPELISVASTPMIGSYQFPPLEFLQHPGMALNPAESKEELMDNARLMQQTLAQADIEVALGDITKGPTLTLYELHLAPGVKPEEIQGLSNNLSAALKADRINILEPIPGKNSVGIEVPNLVKTKVIMRDLLESDEWRNSKAHIPLALGKDVYGHPIISDLAEMPHLLVGGNVGSGKSIFINATITSLLYKFSPNQLRFVMIDPNGLELQQYNALPHLVVPVITDPKKAILGLRWVVNELEKRYQIFMRVGVRNIASFNSRPKRKPLPVGEGLSHEDDTIIPEKLSFIVVVIENLESLMEILPIDMEFAITRITQLARPTGIHLIVTTRSTARNTLSEMAIKEIPARIAFRCTSRIESRIILGAVGAENLLGKGDMLYLPPGSARLIRAQGVLITSQEIQSAVDFIAKQTRPSYELEIHQVSKHDGGSGIDEDEGLIEQCIEVIRSEQKASVSLLQRRLRLGYTCAARIMDELENRGIVGPSKGAEPRDILVDLNGNETASCAYSSGNIPVEPPSIIRPNFIVCRCEHCSQKIEFDANELGDRKSVAIACPHCRGETTLNA